MVLEQIAISLRTALPVVLVLMLVLHGCIPRNIALSVEKNTPQLTAFVFGWRDGACAEHCRSAHAQSFHPVIVGRYLSAP
jgi:hypothetical protein